MNKTKQLMEEAILFAIASIKEDIATSIHTEENALRAQAIKTLAEAYNIVHRGKRGQE